MVVFRTILAIHTYAAFITWESYNIILVAILAPKYGMIKGYTLYDLYFCDS